MKPTKVTLTFDNGLPPIDLPILSGNLGSDVIDIRNLGKHGIFTYDPGFLSTASCHSEITYIDGEEGLLYYRGYPIEQLAEHCDFLEVSYLLMYGELPNAAEKQQFTEKNHAAHHAARSAQQYFPGIQTRRTSDGRHGRHCRFDVSLLSRGA